MVFRLSSGICDLLLQTATNKVILVTENGIINVLHVAVEHIGPCNLSANKWRD